MELICSSESEKGIFFSSSIDIPIDQELPDEEPARRNKDIVNYRLDV